MPISSYSVIPDVVNKLVIKQPKTVLDIGIGNGLYGCLIKNYLPNCHVTGIEGWEKYRNKMWELYDSIIVQSVPYAFEFLKGKFDAIIMCDVIEHFDEKQAHFIVEILKNLLTETGIILISTPQIFVAQGAYAGNELETHRSLIRELPGFTNLREQGPDRFQHYMNVFIYQK